MLFPTLPSLPTLPTPPPDSLLRQCVRDIGARGLRWPAGATGATATCLAGGGRRFGSARRCGGWSRAAKANREEPLPRGHREHDELATIGLVRRRHAFGSGRQIGLPHHLAVVAVVGAHRAVGCRRH